MNQLTIFLIVLMSCSQQKLDECQYEKYFDTITKALNEKYSNEDWGEVNELFKAAINNVEFSYGKDLDEALEVAVRVKDEEFCKQIIKELLEGGIPIEYFNKYPEIKKENYWQEIVSDYVGIGLDQKRFNVKARYKLIALRLRDSIRNIHFHQNRRGEIFYSKDYLTKESQGIYEQFKNLTREYGFPSEKNVGYFYDDNKIQNSPLQVVLIHLHQNGYFIINNEFTYDELICEGHMNRFNYDFLLELNNAEIINEFKMEKEKFNKENRIRN